MSRSPISCHVLDASLGKPAAEVKVSLDCLSLRDTPVDGVSLNLPLVLATGETDTDGRCTDLLRHGSKLSPGTYKMMFFTGPYFESSGRTSFYPLVEVTFNYADPKQHYHIPLLISPYSYTTYRGN